MNNEMTDSYIRENGHCRWCQWLVEDIGHKSGCPVYDIEQIAEKCKDLDCEAQELLILRKVGRASAYIMPLI